MENNYYCTINDCGELQPFFDRLQEYSQKLNIPVYIIDKPLSYEDKSPFEYRQEAIILIPNTKIVVVNLGKDAEAFADFFEDFIDELGFLSKKFDYEQIIGRKREWTQCIDKSDMKEICDLSAEDYVKSKAASDDEKRRLNLLVSLLIGSINDVKRIGKGAPNSILDQVKRKIVLFDGKQTHFIYEDGEKSLITIQGLAGTGKTELLLHKLIKLYVHNEKNRIAFTCYNQVLAKDMENRIPRFFNSMKVDEQIEWNSRLWVFRSWGSKADPNSGLYSYICHFYNLPFLRYSECASFTEACSKAVSELKARMTHEFCFDYVFVDEGQDFPEEFFDLCKVVTSKQVYIAGDIFQNIFDLNIAKSIESDYLLNKCYRTDPRTLMVAHSMGMGLFEEPVIRWLEDDEWKACGYEIEKANGKVLLKREPLTRLDMDLTKVNSIQLQSVDTEKIVESVIQCIDTINKENPTVRPDDIAIILLGNNNLIYGLADRIASTIEIKMNWGSIRGWEAKRKINDRVFISNTNNIKGLEFPFVICIEANVITDNIKRRNAIYMALTRSLLVSYFLVNSGNQKFVKTYQEAISMINREGYMVLREPSDDEKRDQAEKIRIELSKQNKSIDDIVTEVCGNYNVSVQQKQWIIELIESLNVDIDSEQELKDSVRDIVEDLLKIKK